MKTDAPDDQASIRLLAAKSGVGQLIGHGGTNIRKTQADTGVRMKIT